MMKRARLHVGRRLALLLLTVAAFLRCSDDRLTGTSVSTDNPDIVAMTFTQDGKTVPVSGRLEVYPVEYNSLIDSLPLATFLLSNSDTFHLSGDSLADKLLRAGTIRRNQDTVFLVNVLVRTMSGKGALLSGLTYEFRENHTSIDSSWRRISLTLASLVDYKGALTVDERPNILNYVVMFGTPYSALVQGDSFAIQSLVPGRYPINWIPFNRDAPATGNGVEAPVYALDRILNTDVMEKFSSGSVLDTIVFPPTGPRSGP